MGFDESDVQSVDHHLGVTRPSPVPDRVEDFHRPVHDRVALLQSELRRLPVAQFDELRLTGGEFARDGNDFVMPVDAHRLDDMKPYLFKTTDYGKTWKSLTATMKPDVYLHAVHEDPKKRGMLYVGTERGIVFSRDDGASFEPLKLNFPTVAVHDLRVKDDDLVVARDRTGPAFHSDRSTERDQRQVDVKRASSSVRLA